MIISCVAKRGVSGTGSKEFRGFGAAKDMQVGSFALRLAREGEWVEIVSISDGRGLRERLSSMGLHVGSQMCVLKNSMDGKLLIGNDCVRLYLGGGMAQRIQVVLVRGGDEWNRR